MTGTSAAVPWWYVAGLAGLFTLVGVLASQFSSWLLARRKNKLDDVRRFEGDIISAYIRLDEIADILHYNAGGDPGQEKETYWEVYREVLRIVTRLSLIASPRVYGLARHYQSVVSDMEPSKSRGPSRMSMPELVEDLDELRKVMRQELRVGAAFRRPWSHGLKLRYERFREDLYYWRMGRQQR